MDCFHPGFWWDFFLNIHSNASLFPSPDGEWCSPLSRFLCLLACPPSASTHPTPTSVPSWWTFSPRCPGWQTVSSAPATTSNFRRNSAPLPRKVGGYLTNNANQSRSQQTQLLHRRVARPMKNIRVGLTSSTPAGSVSTCRQEGRGQVSEEKEQ